MYIEHPDEHPVIKIFQFNFSIIIGKHNTSVYLHIFDIPVIVLRMLCCGTCCGYQELQF